jgi:hypothetical protein
MQQRRHERRRKLMENFERTGTINAIEWLEEEAKEDAQRKRDAEPLRLKIQFEKMRWSALASMYSAIEGSKGNHDRCLRTLGKVQMCYHMGLISFRTYCQISDYLTQN